MNQHQDCSIHKSQQILAGCIQDMKKDNTELFSAYITLHLMKYILIRP